MSLRIGTNIPALAAQRSLDIADRRSEHALKALASGKRIVQAGDDAAGLAISENLRSQQSGIKMAASNANGAISLIQVAEGGLSEQTNVLIRLRELGIQSASDNVSDTERSYLEEEFSNLLSEFDRIALTTSYGNKKLLVGSGEEYEFHIGTTSEPENIVRYVMDSDARAVSIGIGGLSIADQDEARDSLDSIDEGLANLSSIRAKFGAYQSRFQAAANNLETQYENVSSARSRIQDADVAHETAELSSAQVQQNVSIAVLANANSLPERASRLISLL